MTGRAQGGQQAAETLPQGSRVEGGVKCPPFMVNEDNPTIGGGNSRGCEGTESPQACGKCSTGCICVTQLGPRLSQTDAGADGSYLPGQRNRNPYFEWNVFNSFTIGEILLFSVTVRSRAGCLLIFKGVGTRA